MQPTNPTVEVPLTYDEAYFVFRLIEDEHNRLKEGGFLNTAAYVDALAARFDSMLSKEPGETSTAKEDAA